MNVLEKILEELELAALQEDAPLYIGNMAVDGYVRKSVAEGIIRSNMDEANNNGWIPVSKQLPKEHEIVRVTVHSSEWISDYYSDWIPENEKIYHAEEYNVYDGYIDKSGDWTFFDEDLEIRCDKKFGADKSVVYSVVTAWMPKTYPKPYCLTEE